MQVLSKTEYRNELLQKFQSKLSEDRFLNRKLISFQANKTSPIYRWFKYKEGYSASLIKYYIERYNLQGKRVLDPFAGVGASLFAASEYGCISTGIELLPVGVYVMRMRNTLEKINFTKIQKQLENLWEDIKNIESPQKFITHIPITRGAFPEETEEMLNRYLTYANKQNNAAKDFLKFVAFTVLEEISFTRKDGQYLRWDYRSNRTKGKKPFNKGKIEDFKIAIDSKLNEIISDLSEKRQIVLFPEKNAYSKGNISIIEGSCLYKLPQIPDNSFDLIITSPPYANRYDYTRTYALELVYLGKTNEEVKDLRQQMLSCTVENRSKTKEICDFYLKEGRVSDYNQITSTFENNKALNEIFDILEGYKKEGKLNNNGVLRLLKNYFLEMCFVIYEMARVLDDGGKVIMVNDNVKYAGEEIPVDLILSDFAEKFGLTVKNIFVLTQQKGNSSQQMGNHGRTPLRKCVYLWQKK